MSVIRYPFPLLSGVDPAAQANQNNFIRLSDADRVLDEPNDVGVGDRRAANATAPLAGAVEDVPAREDAWSGLEVDQTLGQLMTDFRKHRGLSRDQVAEQTNIPSYYIRMIESDQYDAIPDQLYLLPFFRRYAVFLGLDAQKVVSRFISDFEKAESELIQPPPPKKKTMPTEFIRRWRQVAQAAVVVGILLPCLAWGIETMRGAFRSSGDHSPAVAVAKIAPPPINTESHTVAPVPAETVSTATIPTAPTVSSAPAPMPQPLHAKTRQRRSHGHPLSRHRRHSRHA